MIKSLVKNPHAHHTLNLAWPLVLTQVGQVVTGMVDNIFLGGIGVTEQAAGILSNNLYVLVLVFCIGVSYATTPLVTSAHEHNDLLKKASLFKNSLFINVAVAVVCFMILYLASGLLMHIGQPPEVVDLAIPFFDVLIFSMIPVSLFFTCKQYCEGLSNTRVALIISIVGNLLNIVLNYCLIYGKCGMPALGYMGAAWASFIARLFMGLSFLVVIFKSPATRQIKAVYRQVHLNWQELKDLAKIGFNAGMQFVIEVAAFVIAGFMAGGFGKEQIDAHGIALSLAALTYMFGSGISGAACIRVGTYKAQGDWQEIRHAARIAIRLVLVSMGACGIIFLCFSRYLPMIFTPEPAIVALASQLLIIAALFQLFDGLQVTALGILRGLGDVRIPTAIALVSYWLIALPLAYVLAYTAGLETVGIWIALLVGLVCVAGALYLRMKHLIAKNLAPTA